MGLTVAICFKNSNGRFVIYYFLNCLFIDEKVSVFSLLYMNREIVAIIVLFPDCEICLKLLRRNFIMAFTSRLTKDTL